MAAAVEQQMSPHDDMAYDDVLRLTSTTTPVPGNDTEPPYRCPVSTPANFVHPSPRVRRTKPMPISLEISLTPVSPTKRSAGRKPNKQGGGSTHRSLSQHSSTGGKAVSGGGGRGGNKVPSVLSNADVLAPNPINNRTLDYYYVDKMEEQREEAAVNTYWLRALCAQPVHEILDKYRRRTELRRTRLIWNRTYTTPGERSLLRAWERNVPKSLVPPVRGILASADTQSMRQFRSIPPSERASQFGKPPRAYWSEPSAKSGGYNYSEEVGSEDEGSEKHPPASTVSGNVSVSTARHSLDQRSATMPLTSPNRPLQQDQHHPRSTHPQEQESPETEPPSALPPLNYAMSDHFRIALPDVTDKQWTKRKGTPTTKRRELRPSWKAHVRQEAVTSDSEEAEKTNRSETSSTTQPETPRYSRSDNKNHLPSI